MNIFKTNAYNLLDLGLYFKIKVLQNLSYQEPLELSLGPINNIELIKTKHFVKLPLFCNRGPQTDISLRTQHICLLSLAYSTISLS